MRASLDSVRLKEECVVVEEAMHDYMVISNCQDEVSRKDPVMFLTQCVQPLTTQLRYCS